MTTALKPKTRMIDAVEDVANAVLEAHGVSAIPVDPFKIAIREKIKLCPVSTHEGGFWGRIEYHREVGRFLLFFPEGPNVPETRRNFSIGHELGHYYIPDHRTALEEGSIHNSEPSFICDRQMEREADAFAASLLMPTKAIKRIVLERGFMTLEQLLEFSEQCKTSRESAAIRYAKYTEEPCAILISENGRVRYAFSSDEASYARCVLAKGGAIPADCASRRTSSKTVILQREGKLTDWFPKTYRDGGVWEEAIALGYSDLVLTLVSWE